MLLRVLISFENHWSATEKHWVAIEKYRGCYWEYWSPLKSTEVLLKMLQSRQLLIFSYCDLNPLISFHWFVSRLINCLYFLHALFFRVCARISFWLRLFNEIAIILLGFDWLISIHRRYSFWAKLCFCLLKLLYY